MEGKNKAANNRLADGINFSYKSISAVVPTEISFSFGSGQTIIKYQPIAKP